MEIERKYLVAPFELGSVYIEQFQTYLGWGPEVRIRQEASSNGHITCALTIKTGRGFVRREVEKALTLAEWEELLPASIGLGIHKTRYEVPDWSLDQFRGAFTGLYVAECELPHAGSRVPPLPVGVQFIRDVTGVWSGADLASMTVDEARTFVREQYKP